VRRVCHITTVHPVDDHRILHKECVSLREAGYDVTLIAPTDGDAVVQGVAVRALRAPAGNRLERMLRRPEAAYRAALAVDAELYHFHDPEFLPFGVGLARAGRRVVYDAHEDVAVQMRHKDWIPSRARLRAAQAAAALEAACVGRIDAVVSPSASALDRLRPCQPRGVLVANYPRLETARAPAPWDQRMRAACYVGGITRVRGAHELVDAMAHVDAELLLAGAMWPPTLRSELERSAGWPRVRYLGRVDHDTVTEVLAQAKVGVIPLHPHPAYRDALPVKLFEYLAAGLAVISIDVPRWREVLDARDCGVCVPFGSPRALGAAIGELLDDDERTQAMGARGRSAIEAHYSWRSQANALLDLYDELLA
jgi:glycosyltransferase involved in cell wall biosynthesis